MSNVFMAVTVNVLPEDVRDPDSWIFKLTWLKVKLPKVLPALVRV
jgi:hypothetical protein